MAASYQSPPRPGRPAAPRRHPPRLLYGGIAIFLLVALATAWTVYREWQREQQLSRSRAVVELVRVRTPTRPTDTPGAVAWLDRRIRAYGRSLLADAGAPVTPPELAWSPRYAPLVDDAPDPTRLPEVFRNAAAALRPADDLLPAAPGRLRFLDFEPGAPPVDLELRVQRFLGYRPVAGAPDVALVMTRRRALDTSVDDPENASSRFLRRVVPHLHRAGERLTRAELPNLAAGSRPRAARVYALSEDGTFVSLPLAPDPRERDATILQEGQVFRKQPRLPTFVSNEFFFRFDFDRPAAQQAFYSGLYLDLGGLGLVTTLAVPVLESRPGLRGVAAVDITFEIDWRDFAASIRPPLSAALAELEPPAPRGWQPWSALRAALDTELGKTPARPPADPAILRILDELARTPPVAAQPEHHGEVTGQGSLVAFQVTRDLWLAVLFPEIPSSFPWPAVSLLSLVGLALLVGFERNRRRAEREQAKAEREFQEKQNLLNTMRVPLSVVDPNTDRVVYGNDAAVRLGIEAGSCIGDLVVDDPRAREHYRRMQEASLETRRAYGVPLRVRTAAGESEVRHAVIRSVAVRAPIESLRADERHRLGILFLIEPDADLALWSADLEARARGEERAHLADLLSHGVNNLARLLRLRLRAGAAPGDPFTVWLADYLARRIEVAAWLLAHWQAEPPLPPAVTVEASQVRATLERFERIFALAREEPELRAQLHWSNGALASPETRRDGEVVEVRCDWPESHLLTCPVRGGAGLFLEEVLVNAIKHGRPGCRPRLTIALDALRRELRFEALNEVADRRRAGEDLKPYGGRRILERLAVLFGWRELSFEASEATFRVSWRVPVSERAAAGESD